LIQREIESRGITTVSVTHLPEITRKVKPPRAVHIKFPLGRSFGQAGRDDLQHRILEDLFEACYDENLRGDIKTLPYRWKRD